MAANILVEKSSSFVAKLLQSDQIEIWYPKGNDGAFATFPKVLVCKTCVRFRKLCKKTGTSHLEVKQILGISIPEFEDNLLVSGVNVHDFMLAFTKWLYSSTLRRSLIHYADLWYFGRLIGCPEFQNAALKARQYQDWNVKDVEKLKGRGDDKLLSYILDHFAWSGMRAGVNADMNFVRTLRAREGLREVTQAAVNRIRNGEIQAAPRSDSYKVKLKEALAAAKEEGYRVDYDSDSDCDEYENPEDSDDE